MAEMLKAACIGLRHPHALGLVGTFQQLDGVEVVAYCEDPDGLFYRRETEGGGILHMLGGHWLEVFRFLMGCEVTAVTAVCRPVVGCMGEEMDDVSVVGLEFANGAVGSLQMGYLQALPGG